MMKKGQIAVESLMIYGIAILVVSLAIGGLIYFGVLDLGALLPDTCNIKGGVFVCKEYAIFTDGKIQMEIQNNAGTTLTITNIQVNGTEDSTGIIGNCGVNTPQTVANGNKVLFSDTTCEATEGNLESFAGKKLKADIVIQYSTAGSQITKKAYGTMRATVSS